MQFRKQRTYIDRDYKRGIYRLVKVPSAVANSWLS